MDFKQRRFKSVLENEVYYFNSLKNTVLIFL